MFAIRREDKFIWIERCLWGDVERVLNIIFGSLVAGGSFVWQVNDAERFKQNVVLVFEIISNDCTS